MNFLLGCLGLCQVQGQPRFNMVLWRVICQVKDCCGFFQLPLWNILSRSSLAGLVSGTRSGKPSMVDHFMFIHFPYPLHVFQVCIFTFSIWSEWPAIVFTYPPLPTQSRRPHYSGLWTMSSWHRYPPPDSAEVVTDLCWQMRLWRTDTQP